MGQKIDAIYENGLLKPLEPLCLPDRERVSIIVETRGVDDWLDQDAMDLARREGDVSISLDDVRLGLSAFRGCLADLSIAERGEY